MLFLFKGIKYTFFTTCIFCVAVITCLVVRFFESAGFWPVFILSAVLTLISLVLIAIAFNVWAVKKYAKIFRLFTDCKVDAYIKIVEKLVQNKPKNQSLRIDLANAHLDKGNLPRVKELLEDRFIFKENKKATNEKISYYTVLTKYFFMTKEYDKVSEVLSKIKILVEDKNAIHVRDAAIDHNFSYNFRLNMAVDNNYECAEHFFLHMLEKTPSIRGQVIYQLTLGYIYMHYGRIKRAIEAFEFAAKYGGTTCYAEDAKKRLKELAAPEVQTEIIQI